jgi:hypothetical protein
MSVVMGEHNILWEFVKGCFWEEGTKKALMLSGIFLFGCYW